MRVLYCTGIRFGEALRASAGHDSSRGETMDHDLGYLVGLACGGVVGAIGTIAVIVALNVLVDPAGAYPSQGNHGSGVTSGLPSVLYSIGGA